jgi:hypothetical protein
LEIAINMEAYHVEENGGMAQVQMNFVSVKIKLVELTKGKEMQEQVWCTKCRIEGHHKDKFPTFS